MTIEDLYEAFLKAPEEIRSIPQIVSYITMYESWISFPHKHETFLKSLYFTLEDLNYLYPDILNSFLNGKTIKELDLPNTLIQPEWMLGHVLNTARAPVSLSKEVIEEKNRINAERTAKLAARFNEYLKERELKKQEQVQTTGIEKEKAKLPSLVTQAGTLATSLAQFTASGFKTVTKEVYEERKRICEGCEFFDPAGFGGVGRCRKCGCSSYKLNMAISECPIGLWKSVQDNPPE